MKVKRTERGWAGHFISAQRCRFRRNTLLERGRVRIVVSTVGLLKYDEDSDEFDEVMIGRYFETMAFHAKADDVRYRDPDVERQVSFKSPWQIAEVDADDQANLMHEQVVAELTKRLENGEKL